MNNRTQQRMDRSIRNAVRTTKEALARLPRRDVTGSAPQDDRPVTGRMQFMRDPRTEATVLVPWDHPDAVAWRARRSGAE